MPILAAIGRRSWRVRLLVGAIYALLALGAASMLYPFLLMLAGSTKSAADGAALRVVPAYLVDDTALYRKHVEGLFNESLAAARCAYDVAWLSFETAEPPAAVRPRYVAAWEAFAAGGGLPAESFTCGYLAAPQSRGVLPHLLRRFKGELYRAYDGDLAALNRALGTVFANWSAFTLTAEEALPRRRRADGGAWGRCLQAFKTRQPAGLCYGFSPEGYFKQVYLPAQYTRDVAAYNRAHGTAHATWDAIRLDPACPVGPGRTAAEQEDWTAFVRHILALDWLRMDPAAVPLYRRYLAARYGAVAALNQRHGTAYADFEAIPPALAPPAAGCARTDWEAFLQGWTDPVTGVTHTLPVACVRIVGPEFAFRDHLRGAYATLDALNADLGTAFRDWAEVRPPQRELHYQHFLAHRGRLRAEFTVRNYLSVFDYVLVHGRGVFNTVVYCGLAVLAALIVNPLAAYALSRFRPPSTYKLLLLLMLTMAFPPMVTQIPVFLMLRELNLLNTFWALLLPGLANGYSIFLLKGFFDSLPRELYESAALDGAGEARMFWHITLSLSRPVLAVVALDAFRLAYTNFMFALLICQDERMWTLMPWLYQLQMRSGPGVIHASLIVAAVPTFLIFVFCQNTIMRGIVVPVEK